MTAQHLHLVFGGELVRPDSTEFVDPARIHIVGLFPDYDSALRAWRAEAQRTVDQANTRYFVAHLHRLLDETAPDGPTRELR